MACRSSYSYSSKYTHWKSLLASTFAIQHHIQHSAMASRTLQQQLGSSLKIPTVPVGVRVAQRSQSTLANFKVPTINNEPNVSYFDVLYITTY